jgi:hypothetical protein
MILYLMSIAANVQATLIVAGFLWATVWVTAQIARHIAFDEPKPMSGPYKYGPVIVAVLFGLAALLPTPESLLKAQLMTEARKIGTADNGQKVIEFIGSRIDKALGKVGEGK